MSVLGNAKSDSHRKTHKVEPDGTGRKYMFLLGEASQARVSEESAEAIVVMTLAERQEERRAEESRKKPDPNLNGKARRNSKLGGVATAATAKGLRKARAGGTCLSGLRGFRV